MSHKVLSKIFERRTRVMPDLKFQVLNCANCLILTYVMRKLLSITNGRNGNGATRARALTVALTTSLADVIRSGILTALREVGDCIIRMHCRASTMIPEKSIRRRYEETSQSMNRPTYSASLKSFRLWMQILSKEIKVWIHTDQSERFQYYG